jgi:hypothetical protein
VVVGVQFLRMRGAYADDGGWSECVGSDNEPCSGLGGIFDWLRSPGAGAVMAQSTVGGISAAIGAAFGVGAGGALASLGAAAQTIARGPGSASGQALQDSGQHPAPADATATTGTAAGDASTAPSAAGGASTASSADGGGAQPGSSAGGAQPGSSAGGAQPTSSATGDAQPGAGTQPYATQPGAHAPGQTSDAPLSGGTQADTAGAQPSGPDIPHQGYLQEAALHETTPPGPDPGQPDAGPGGPGQPSDGPGHQPGGLGNLQDLLPEQADRKERESDTPTEPPA